jgi:alginate O-acetyltransferase complex protein AlgJ
MNKPRIPTKIQPRAEGVLIAVFVAFLCLPALDSALRLDRTPAQQENRNLATFPTFKGLAELRPFLAGAEAFVNDHFGFRQRLLRWNNTWKLKVFNEFSTGSILLGREGWIYWTSDGGLADYCGTSRFNEQQLRDWQALLETRRDWLAGRGIKYIFVIPPNKQSIYPEYIPNWLKKSDTPSKLDQLMAHMKAYSTVEVLDLRPAFIAAKPAGLLFLKTDTHWNGLGAFVACAQVARELSRQMPGIKPLALDAFDRKSVVERAGDCARFIGQGDELQETQQIVFSPRPPLPALQLSQGSQHQGKKWPEPDPRISENENGAVRAVVHGDSFAEALMPLLGYCFREVIYLARPDWDKEFLERERPDVVIDEMVERFVVTRDPKKLMQSDALKPAAR